MIKDRERFVDQDVNLVEKACQGNEQAFVQLYRKHVSMLYFFVFKKVSDQTEAEDITSETFYQALKDLKKFSGKSTFKNWLYGIAKHLILAHYREKYNRPSLELHENIANEEPLLDEQNNQKKENQIQEILQNLPENYRNILELRFLRGYSIIETADALGLTPENVKVLQHRAIKKAQHFGLSFSS